MNINNFYLKSVSFFLIFSFIFIIIPLNLFPCFISGMIVHETIVSLTSKFEKLIGNNKKAKLFIIILISIFFITTLIIGIISLISLFTFYSENNTKFFSEINRIIINIKNRFPHCYFSFLPGNIEEIKKQIFFIIESNIYLIKNVGKNFLHKLVTIFIGIIIGVIISLHKPFLCRTYFVQQLSERIYYFSQSFRNILLAQIKVSMVNTVLTTVILGVIFPTFKIYLPFRNVLVFITFIFGLLPIIGNIISNIIITASALSISATVGGIMLIYLVFIHKIEYFLNAKIIGNYINAKSWEIFLVMLIFESIFGFEGLIAAPIYYGYLKKELKIHKII